MSIFGGSFLDFFAIWVTFLANFDNMYMITHFLLQFEDLQNQSKVAGDIISCSSAGLFVSNFFILIMAKFKYDQFPPYLLAPFITFMSSFGHKCKYGTKKCKCPAHIPRFAYNMWQYCQVKYVTVDDSVRVEGRKLDNFPILK